MNSIRLAILTLAAALGTGAGAAGEASPSSTQVPGAPPPSTGKAAAPGKASPKKSVTDVSCGRYLDLPESARSTLIGWVAGQGYRKGAFAPWLVDADKSGAVVAAVAESCRKAPDASLWYTVKGELRKVH